MIVLISVNSAKVNYKVQVCTVVSYRRNKGWVYW